MDMNAKVFRDVDVGSSHRSHDPEERKVRHVLHGREEKSRTILRKHGLIKEIACGSGSAKSFCRIQFSSLAAGAGITFLGVNFIPRFL